MVELLRVRENDLAALLTGTMRAELSYFLFQCLFFVNPASCRKSAAEALGFLSKCNLDAVVLLFTKASRARFSLLSCSLSRHPPPHPRSCKAPRT